jgi:hypothetical protein
VLAEFQNQTAASNGRSFMARLLERLEAEMAEKFGLRAGYILRGMLSIHVRQIMIGYEIDDFSQAFSALPENVKKAWEATGLIWLENNSSLLETIGKTAHRQVIEALPENIKKEAMGLMTALQQIDQETDTPSFEDAWEIAQPYLAAVKARAKELESMMGTPSFEDAWWAENDYSDAALEQVRLGWEIAQPYLAAAKARVKELESMMALAADR